MSKLAAQVLLASVMCCHFMIMRHIDHAGVKELVVSPVKKKRKTRNENTCLEVYRDKPNLSPISSKKVASQKKLVSTVPRHSFTKRITRHDITSLFVSTTVPLFIYSFTY